MESGAWSELVAYQGALKGGLAWRKSSCFHETLKEKECKLRVPGLVLGHFREGKEYKALS